MPLIANMETDVERIRPGIRFEPRLRSRGRFRQVAIEVPLNVDGANRIGFGVMFPQFGPLELTYFVPDCEEPDPPITGDSIAFDWGSAQPFSLWQALTCNTLSAEPELPARAANATLDWLIDEALTAATLGGVAIPDAVTLDGAAVAVGAYQTVGETIGAVEGALTLSLSNLEATIFVPPQHLGTAVGEGAVRIVDGQLETPLGNRVISDAGHYADDTIYGAGPIYYAVVDGPAFDNGVDIVNDTHRELAAKYGIVWFNQNWTAQATVGEGS